MLAKHLLLRDPPYPDMRQEHITRIRTPYQYWVEVLIQPSQQTLYTPSLVLVYLSIDATLRQTNLAPCHGYCNFPCLFKCTVVAQ